MRPGREPGIIQGREAVTNFLREGKERKRLEKLATDRNKLLARIDKANREGRLVVDIAGPVP